MLDLAFKLTKYALYPIIIIAVFDVWQSRYAYKESMKMTKDEVKREYKEMEGSQEIKQAQRDFRNELLNGPDPAPAAKKATVVVTNPTHLAIGIRYNAEEAPLPRIIVAGEGRNARIIRETALAEGIPIMENVPLAHALWNNGRIDEFIPDDLIEPVAEVLKWVKKLQDAKKEEEELDSITIE